MYLSFFSAAGGNLAIAIFILIRQYSDSYCHNKESHLKNFNPRLHYHKPGNGHK